MTQSAVRVGRISTRKGAVIHLEINLRGIADDHSRHVSRPVTHHHLVDTANLCRRCFTPNRVRAAQAALMTATGIEAETIRQLLARVADTLKPAAELDADADLAARIAATIQAAPLIRPLPRDEQWDAWEAARDSYDATRLPAAA